MPHAPMTLSNQHSSHMLHAASSVTILVATSTSLLHWVEYQMISIAIREQVLWLPCLRSWHDFQNQTCLPSTYGSRSEHTIRCSHSTNISQYLMTWSLKNSDVNGWDISIRNMLIPSTFCCLKILCPRQLVRSCLDVPASRQRCSHKKNHGNFKLAPKSQHQHLMYWLAHANEQS